MTNEKEEEFIDPGWLRRARARRGQFAVYVIILFGVLSGIAWVALPFVKKEAEKINQELGSNVGRIEKEKRENADQILSWVGWFRAFWLVIAIGCGAAILLAMTGKIDTFVPILNIAVLLIGVGAIAFTVYIFWLPTRSVLENM